MHLPRLPFLRICVLGPCEWLVLVLPSSPSVKLYPVIIPFGFSGSLQEILTVKLSTDVILRLSICPGTTKMRIKLIINTCRHHVLFYIPSSLVTLVIFLKNSPVPLMLSAAILKLYLVNGVNPVKL